jgi:hypothetical protein
MKDSTKEWNGEGRRTPKCNPPNCPEAKLLTDYDRNHSKKR